MDMGGKTRVPMPIAECHEEHLLQLFSVAAMRGGHRLGPINCRRERSPRAVHRRQGAHDRLGVMTASNVRGLADRYVKPMRQRQLSAEAIDQRQRIYLGAFIVLGMVFLVSGFLALS